MGVRLLWGWGRQNPLVPTPHDAPPDAALTNQRLAALFAAGVLLLNFPLLALWDHPRSVFGLPLFPLALFCIWALLIGALAWLLECQPD